MGQGFSHITDPARAIVLRKDYEIGYVLAILGLVFQSSGSYFSFYSTSSPTANKVTSNATAPVTSAKSAQLVTVRFITSTFVMGIFLLLSFILFFKTRRSVLGSVNIVQLIMSLSSFVLLLVTTIVTAAWASNVNTDNMHIGLIVVPFTFYSWLWLLLC